MLAVGRGRDVDAGPVSFHLPEVGSYSSAALIALAHEGARSLVAWTDFRNDRHPDIKGARVTDIHGNRVSREGQALDGERSPISASPMAERHPALASTGRVDAGGHRPLRHTFRHGCERRAADLLHRDPVLRWPADGDGARPHL